MTFVTTSEEVKMLEAGGSEVDKYLDERAGILFDKLLDLAVSLLKVNYWVRITMAKRTSRPTSPGRISIQIGKEVSREIKM